MAEGEIGEAYSEADRSSAMHEKRKLIKEKEAKRKLAKKKFFFCSNYTNKKKKNMESFNFLWDLIANNGSVADKYKAECARVWNEYSLQQQREIYRSIRDKLRAGKFVNYNPVKAVKENAPKAPKQLTLTFKEYYARFGTTAEQDGWRMTNPTGQQVIYIKNLKTLN